MKRYGNDSGYSIRNLKYMRQFAVEYPDFPFVQVLLAQIQDNQILKSRLSKFTVTADGEFVQVPLAQITWYHHISLLTKVKSDIERAFYITETAQNGWSRDVMLMQIANGYINAKGHAINNFTQTLPPPQSDLARYIFKDPYNFSFLGTVALQNELDIEKSLTSKVTDFLLEMGRGFAYIDRQYHISVDGDDYYIDILMYHLKLHCYVVIELKAVEFKPEFVSKLNFYISAVDEYVKSPEDKPTIGLLLCRTKSDKKAEFSLRGITQPMGIAQYETEKLFADVASSLPQIEDVDKNDDLNITK
jgi:predicted nuclease of restriction endonuclease-like (RecB) superfamily